MAATIVGFVKVGGASFSPTTPGTTQTWPSGSSIIVVSGFRPAADTDPAHYVITDGSGATYTREVFSMAANNGGLTVYARHNIGSALATGTTFTIKMGDTASKVAAYVMCVTGLDYTGGTPLDKTSINPADGTNSPSAATYTSNATTTTSTADQFLVGGLLEHIDVGAATVSASWATLDSAGVGTTGGSAGSNAWAWVQTRTVAATGAYTSNPTGTARNYRSAIVTYKISAGGGGGGTPTNLFFGMM